MSLKLKAQLADNQPVQETLSPWGSIHIERCLPFLVVVRGPETGGASLDRLVSAEASYLVASDQPADAPALKDLVRGVVETLAPQFGTFLLFEIWALPADNGSETAALIPRFQLDARDADDLGDVLTRMARDLSRLTVSGNRAQVTLKQHDQCAPPGLEPLLTLQEAEALGCTIAGLGVAPIHADPKTGELFPALERELRGGLSKTLRKAFHRYTSARSTQCPANYQVLGPTALVDNVWAVDKELAEVADSFDFLLQVSPVNHHEAWEEFKRSSYERAPVFHYRPLSVDTIVLKRRLYQAPVETIDDPAMAVLFREKLDELDRMVTLLHDINTPRFKHGSAQLYGVVDNRLLRDAHALLEQPEGGDTGNGPDVRLNANEIAKLARAEIEQHYRHLPEIDPGVEIRADITSGLMVSRGVLLVGEYANIPQSRIEALFAHEIGTHMLSYFNGRAQPIRQFCSGLAGYDELQEGTAVLAEYLVGGLSRGRLRILAARVVAVRHMMEGASFVDVYRELSAKWGLQSMTAFSVTTRVFRGGGLCKDAVYLRGLASALRYLGRGGDLEILFMGKIAMHHVPIVRELRLRGVLKASPLRPPWLDRPDVVKRIAKLRSGASLQDLVQ